MRSNINMRKFIIYIKSFFNPYRVIPYTVTKIEKDTINRFQKELEDNLFWKNWYMRNSYNRDTHTFNNYKSK